MNEKDIQKIVEESQNLEMKLKEKKDNVKKMISKIVKEKKEIKDIRKRLNELEEAGTNRKLLRIEIRVNIKVDYDIRDEPAKYLRNIDFTLGKEEISLENIYEKCGKNFISTEAWIIKFLKEIRDSVYKFVLIIYEFDFLIDDTIKIHKVFSPKNFNELISFYKDQHYNYSESEFSDI